MWALWETREACQRAYDGEPMHEEKAAVVLSRLALTPTGLVEDDDIQHAITTVSGVASVGEVLQGIDDAEIIDTVYAR